MPEHDPAAALLDARAILEQLHIRKPIECIVLRTVDSTNAEAKRRLRAGTKPPFLVAADAQTAGRGRLGRDFYSPAGDGVYLSIACPLFGTESDALRLTTMASVAVASAIEALTGLHPGIKWVNDLYLDHKKICGILCEGICDPAATTRWAVVGIGLNLRSSGFPEGIADVAGALGTNVPREAFIARIVNLFFELLDKSDYSYMDDYRARSLVLGREITYQTFGEATPRLGVATAILDDGALLVRNEDGTTACLRSGEITVRLRP